MASKLLSTTSTKKPNAPASVQEWNQLLSKTIQRALSTEDRRLEGLRKAMMEGKAEKILRQMSVLSEVDLDREFPVRT
jgi:hypothetical protein